MKEVPSVDEVQAAFPEYTVIEQIGLGGEGVVFVVEVDGVQCALKILLSDDDEAVAQFEKEGRVINELDHPYVIKGYGSGEIAGFNFILMEYCEGGSLLDRLSEEHLCDETVAATVARIGKGLHYAHSKGVLHRDIKPENIMIDAAGNPKLVDFGLAYCAGEDASLLEAVGSEGYAAPEIWTHPERVSIQTDVYAMGALLYTVLTGVFPDAHNVNYNHLFSRDKAFILFIVKAMAKDPAQRFSNMAEYVNELLKIRANIGKPPAIW